MHADAEFAELIEDHLKLAQQVLGHIDSEIIEGVKGKMEKMSHIVGKAVRWATADCSVVQPKHAQPDLFARLGPVYFFNAMCALVERRSHTITYVLHLVTP
jgi:hypothetical protein